MAGCPAELSAAKNFRNAVRPSENNPRGGEGLWRVGGGKLQTHC